MATINTGYQGWKVLEGYYTDNLALSGMIMPNIKMISPEAIVPDGTTITYNQVTDVTPTGGTNGDIWYNEPSDTLYRNVSGSWYLLTDRVINSYYQAPIQNLTACPL